MSIGKSSITKKQWNTYKAQFALLNTKEERIEWLANGNVDVMELWDMTEDKIIWVPMINHVRFCDDKEPVSFDNREDALKEALKIKSEFQQQVKSLKIKQ